MEEVMVTLEHPVNAPITVTEAVAEKILNYPSGSGGWSRKAESDAAGNIEDSGKPGKSGKAGEAKKAGGK